MYSNKTGMQLLNMLQLLLVSFMFSSCVYSSKATKQQLETARGKAYDVVVVPGVPIMDGEWSDIMKGRIYWSKYLFESGIAKNIMYSGSAVYSPYYEGKVMALYANAIGIPAENIFYEIEAEHSTENIYYSFKKAKKMGFGSIALASDPFQTKSLRRFAKKRLSTEIGMIPMVMDSMRSMEPQMINPEIDLASAFKSDFVSLKKRESFFKRLKGTMGLNIKYED